MVENKIVQIVFENLKEYIALEDINFSLSHGVFKYTFNISNYYFEISYNFMDSFYRIRFEIMINNEIKDVIFLTKSKKFRKDIKSMLKTLKISRKTFDNHISAFTAYLSKILKQFKNLSCLEEMYTPNLRFDGIFI